MKVKMSKSLRGTPRILDAIEATQDTELDFSKYNCPTCPNKKGVGKMIVQKGWFIITDAVGVTFGIPPEDFKENWTIVEP